MLARGAVMYTTLRLNALAALACAAALPASAVASPNPGLTPVDRRFRARADGKSTSLQRMLRKAKRRG